MKSSCYRVCSAIGYPEEDLRVEGETLILLIDDCDVRVAERNGRFVYSCVLLRREDSDFESMLERLAGYSAGRLLKEDATLCWDEASQSVMLWQSVRSDGDDVLLRRVMELFLTSCDWWRRRVAEREQVRSSYPEMVIRP